VKNISKAYLCPKGPIMGLNICNRIGNSNTDMNSLTFEYRFRIPQDKQIRYCSNTT